ncbi:MAG: hypothetical protein KDK45_05665, partial [Leptospiraceae bacterium]|nr:hypothetical protein [Leptospiraceae bacterium]
KKPQSNEILNLIAYAMLFVSIGLSFVLPKLLLKSLEYQKQLEASKQAGVYQTLKIIQGALIEGACMLNAVVFFMTGRQDHLGAILLGVLVMLFHFPRESDFVKLLGEPKLEMEKRSSNSEDDDRF